MTFTNQLQRFRAVSELQKSLDKKITTLNENSNKLSNLIGEKLRATDNTSTSEVQEFKQNMEGTTKDLKKKKVTKKKDQKSIWYELDAISVYDGMGLKGELELYFKDLEEMKAESVKLTKVKQTIDNLVSRGLRRELGCVIVLGHELPAEIAFFKTPPTKKFKYKSIFNVPKDDTHGL
jgi:hypothetical protein